MPKEPKRRPPPTAMEIEQILEGLRYPAAKPQVIAHARQHDARVAVLRVLDQLPALEWQSTRDVMKALAGEIGDGALSSNG